MNDSVKKLKQVAPTPRDFFESYSVSLQMEFLQVNVSLPLLAESEVFPKLAVVAEAYGKDTLLLWLRSQYQSFAQFWGPNREVVDSDLRQLALITFGQCSSLNVGEILWFIAGLKSQRFGNLYDASPLKISGALQSFLSERSQTLQEWESEREKQRMLEKQQEEEARINSRENLESCLQYFIKTNNNAFADIYRRRLADYDQNHPK